MMEIVSESITYRKKEISDKFISELDTYLNKVKSGEIENSRGTKNIADLLFINPNHLSDTIKNVFGKSPCKIYEEKLIDICKELIANSDKPIKDIAFTFSYEPSNFIKFFKRHTGLTPKQYRAKLIRQKTEKPTI